MFRGDLCGIYAAGRPQKGPQQGTPSKADAPPRDVLYTSVNLPLYLVQGLYSLVSYICTYNDDLLAILLLIVAICLANPGT